MSSRLEILLATCPPPPPEAASAWKPSPNQEKLVEALLHGDDTGKPLSVAAACRLADINRKTAYRYFDDPYFIDYFRKKRVKKSKAWGAAVDYALIAKCLSGDVQAMRLFYERFDALEYGLVVREEEGVTFRQMLESVGEELSEEEVAVLRKLIVKLERRRLEAEDAHRALPPPDTTPSPGAPRGLAPIDGLEVEE